MSRLKLRALRLTVRTPSGSAGRTLHFQAGLNVLRADNSSGKSTALQAIIYALGLEGMLGPSQRVPLPHAMTDTLTISGDEGRVIESMVELEMENGEGQIATISRTVQHPTKDRRLVSVLPSAGITEVAAGAVPTDYFVRRQGAAQSHVGFHRYLAQFLGLELPRVTRNDGSEVLLYLETLFPYFFVEQKHGWSGIQARIPSYLGVREVGKRTAEFVLGLEAFNLTLQRQRVRSSLAELEAEWQAASARLEGLASLSGVVIHKPAGRIQNGLADDAMVPMVALEDRWLPLDEGMDRLLLSLQSLGAETPSVASSVEGLVPTLRQSEAKLSDALALAAGLAEERQELELHRRQVELRLEALREDLQRHKDTAVLERLGGGNATAFLSDHVCPTCRQELADGADISSHAMTVAESIAFIEQQISTFAAMTVDDARVAAALDSRQQSLGTRIDDLRAEIRATRETLTSANSAPSIAAISNRLVIEHRLRELEKRAEPLMKTRQVLASVASKWSQQRKLLKRLEQSELTQADREKLESVERRVREQLQDYGFQSLNPLEIDVDRATYRPVHEGFDLGFDLSASDMIRVIWAYLFAMLAVGRQPGGNHLGLLVFDEPRQQETAHSSYAALLARASAEAANGAQILFATSEPHDSLTSMLDSDSVHLISLSPGEKLLRPLAEDGASER